MNKHTKPEKTQAKTTIHSLSHDGRGIALVANKTTFVSGALPGETVAYKITLKRSNYNEAETLEVIESSAQRVSPPCPHFGVCGGCSLQHMSDDAQIQLKQKTLLEQLKHFGKVIPASILAPLTASTSGYRHKARLGVTYVTQKNKLIVGFREKSSSHLTHVQKCMVLHPRVGEQLPDLNQLISSLEKHQSIPQIEVAIGDNEVALVIRHMRPLPLADRDKLVSFGVQHHFQIYLQPNSPAPIEKLWPQDNQDRLSYNLPDYNLEFLFHPLDFTQVNLEMNRLMVKQALQLLDVKTEDKVLDLFCGIGNFTLPIARQASHVTGIEGGAEMVSRAENNAAHNNINNVAFYTANLMEPSVKATWMKARYDKVLLDPPRAGAKEILPFIAKCGAKKIVYVSCNPATLARDAGELVHQYGYKLQQAGIMNMFPHTSHIEAMAVFEK